MKTKTCIIALGMLMCLLMTTLMVSATEDDCFNCEDQNTQQQPFNKLYCKVWDIQESDLYNKVTLKIETRTHGINDLEYVTFYNVSDSQLRIIDDNKMPGLGQGLGSWINIYYIVDYTDMNQDDYSQTVGKCYVLMVEKAEMASNNIPIGIGFLLLGLVGTAVISFFIGLVLGDIWGN